MTDTFVGRITGVKCKKNLADRIKGKVTKNLARV